MIAAGYADRMQQSHERDTERPPEDEPEEPGAEGGSGSPAVDKPPAAPADDDSALGDTDQHSDSSS